MTVTFERRSKTVRREKPDLSPPIEHVWPWDQYHQYLGPGRRQPPPSGAGWHKVGRIHTCGYVVTFRPARDGGGVVFGPPLRWQSWRRDRTHKESA